MSILALLVDGKSFARSLETAGAIAVRAPLEGGFEGRYLRRLRALGYEPVNLTARGLGDLSAYLTDVHGVRPPHLGKKTVGQQAAVGFRYFVAPRLTYRLQEISKDSKGIVLWIIEGNILASQEIAYLVELPKMEPRVKVVVEVGGARIFEWQPLEEYLSGL